MASSYKINEQSIDINQIAARPGLSNTIADTYNSSDVFKKYNNMFPGYEHYYFVSAKKHLLNISNGTSTTFWGKQLIDDSDKYLIGGQSLDLVKSSYCSFPNRKKSTGKSAYNDQWGDARYCEGKVEISYDAQEKKLKVTDGKNELVKPNSTSVIFVDIVAGGGGGGGAYGRTNQGYAGGGGGGGGGFSTIALDIAKTGKVTINIGQGGDGYQSSYNEDNLYDDGPFTATSGGDTTLTTSNGVTITCKGGSGGGCGHDHSTSTGVGGGRGGNGGTVNNSLGNHSSNDPSKGILFVQSFYGKSGGNGSDQGKQNSEDGGSFKRDGIGADGSSIDTITNFSIVDNLSIGLTSENSLAVANQYYGVGGYQIFPFDESGDIGDNRSSSGGGGGSTAIGGGDCNPYMRRGALVRTDFHNGVGGCGAYSWEYDGYSYYMGKTSSNTTGQKGHSGCCIVHCYWKYS